MNRVVCCIFLFLLMGCASLPIMREREGYTTPDLRENEASMTRTPVPDNELTYEISVVQGQDREILNCRNELFVGMLNHGMETWRLDGVPTRLPTARLAFNTMEGSVVAVAGQSWEVDGCYFELLEVVIGPTFHEGYARLKVTPINPP